MAAMVRDTRSGSGGSDPNNHLFGEGGELEMYTLEVMELEDVIAPLMSQGGQ